MICDDPVQLDWRPPNREGSGVDDAFDDAAHQDASSDGLHGLSDFDYDTMYLLSADLKDTEGKSTETLSRSRAVNLKTGKGPTGSIGMENM
jgi:hypothetical protein